MTLFVMLAGIYAVVEGLMRAMGRPRAVEVPRVVALLGTMIGAILIAAALLGAERTGVPLPFVVLLSLGVYGIGAVQVTHAVRRVRRQDDSQAHRLYMYLKTREVSESQERRGEDGALADEDSGPFHLG